MINNPGGLLERVWLNSALVFMQWDLCQSQLWSVPFPSAWLPSIIMTPSRCHLSILWALLHCLPTTPPPPPPPFCPHLFHSLWLVISSPAFVKIFTSLHIFFTFHNTAVSKSLRPHWKSDIHKLVSCLHWSIIEVLKMCVCVYIDLYKFLYIYILWVSTLTHAINIKNLTR